MSTPDDPVPALARLPSRVSGLDEILRGGFLEGGVYILQGLLIVGGVFVMIAFLRKAQLAEPFFRRA